jgi:DNA repair protein RecN (Recombination protein N)
MLVALSIRDVVLIERLELAFGPGLTVLTGETGAGKSILLDSLGLALGARADAGLIRAGADQANVTAVFAPAETHPVYALLAEHSIPREDGAIVLRRVLTPEGRSRAYVNDQPVGAALLRRIGARLVEIQSQNDQIGLADAAGHGALLDGFAVPGATRAAVATAWRRLRDCRLQLEAAVDAIAAARRDEAWLRHAVDDLTLLNPREGEEQALAAERQSLQQDERRAEAIAAALAELTPQASRRGGGGPGAALRAAARALSRLLPRQGEADPGAAPVLAAIERAEEALAEAEHLLSRLASSADTDPRRLEQAEERLFALRAAARKFDVAVLELPSLRAQLETRLAALDTGTAAIVALEHGLAAARADFAAAAAALTAARRQAAAKLEQAINRELPPLKLRARFVVELTALPEPSWGAQGADQVRFLIAANPGQPPGPLARVASGGEMSRLMLALKVVLSGDGMVPTLVFDEVDSGIGGATAAAVGERLHRVATRLQVLVVTHSPQVAARGAAHLRVSKADVAGRTRTDVAPLAAPARREEIARMLAGEQITDAARAAAGALLAHVD